MSYPPPSGFTPYSQQASPALGFSSGQTGPGEGTNYSLLPTSASYPSESTSFPTSSNNSMYPSVPGNSPYPPAMGGAPYPPATGGAPYPPATEGAPYPPAMGGTPYPPAGGSPYPPTGGSPYPPAGGSPYPPAGGSPYPPAGGSYPPPTGGSPYPSAGGSAYPAPTKGSPYPAAGGSPHPAPTGGAGYPPTGGAGYPPTGGANFPPSTGGATYPAFGGANYTPSTGGAPYQAAGTTYPPTGGSPYPHSTGSMSVQPPTSGHGYPLTAGFEGGSPYASQSTSSTYAPTVGATSTAAYQSPMHHKPTEATGYPSLGSKSAHGTIKDITKERPTVRASMSFDPSTDAATLKKAMKGFGTDEKAIVQVLGRRTSYQRQQIILKYQQAYGKDLLKDLKGELGGNFEQVVVAIMTPLPNYVASELRKSMSGIGTKESVLIEILCSSDNNCIRVIKAAYSQMYHTTLEKDINSETSGMFKRLLISMCAGHRDEQTRDASLASSLAQSLYKAGVGRTGTDDTEFNRIMASYSYEQLRLVFDEYRKIKGKSFEDAIKSELSGDFEDGMLAVYRCTVNRPAFFAKKLRDAMAGMGTRDDALVRLIVSRCEIDLGTIKEEYRKEYGKTLESAISSETSGDYKKMLLALLQD